MASQKTESASQKQAKKSQEPEKTEDKETSKIDDPETDQDVETAAGTTDGDGEPRSGSLSSLLKRIEDSDAAEEKGDDEEAAKISDELAEMNELLLQSETGDDIDDDVDTVTEDGREVGEPDAHVPTEIADDYWGPDGFEKDDDEEVRPDNELMSLINELNGKLDRAHDVIARSLPNSETPPQSETAPEVQEFDPPPPSVFERKLFPNSGRIREAIMFTGMWGALLAAIIAVVYSNSWWLSEPPAKRDQVTARDAERAPKRTQSLNRLGALGGTALSQPEVPFLSPSGNPSSAEQDAENEPRRPPRPATPDAPAASGDSVTEAISRALTSPETDALANDIEADEMPVLEEQPAAPVEEKPEVVKEPKAAKKQTTVVETRPEPVKAKPKPKVVRVTAPLPEQRRVARAPNRPYRQPAMLAPIQEPDTSSAVTAVSEWRRVARATLGSDLIREAEKSDDEGAAFSVGVVRGRAGEAISMPIRLPRIAKDTEASIMIKGMPDGSQLSAGEQAGQSTWILTASDVDGLKLITPRELGAVQLALEVTLVTSDGSVPNTKLLSLELAAAEPKVRVETVVAKTPPPPLAPISRPLPARPAEPSNPKEAEAAALLERGQKPDEDR